MTQWLSENRTLLLRLFGTVVAIVLIVLLIRQEGWTEIVNSLRQISPVSFFLALVALLISRVFVIARWHVLLQSGGVKIPFSRSAELTLMGLFASHFLPTTIGGDVVRLAGVMQMGFDRAICLASIPLLLSANTVVREATRSPGIFPSALVSSSVIPSLK